MKKVKIFACVGGVAFLALFVSCKNFLQGSDFFDKLNDAIQYANANFVDVTINASATSTDLVSPTAGLHSSEYKAKDHIDLQFTAKMDYQFVNWYAEPAGSVEFVNANDSSTQVHIVSDTEPIVITPKVYERPTVSFSPSTTSASVAKNTHIILSFSQAMNLTDEDLEQIKISMDNVSVNDNFQKPFLSEDNTQVIFNADRHNMINLESGEKRVDVFVPNTFFHTEADANVTLGHDYYYSYKINSQTSDNANVTFECAVEYGKLSFNGTKKFYLDNELEVSFTPDKKYKITGWSVKYLDETKVDPYTLNLTASEDLCNIKVTLLDGSNSDIKVTPIVQPRPGISNSLIQPADVKAGQPMDSEFCISIDRIIDAAAIESAAEIRCDSIYLSGEEANEQYFTPKFVADPAENKGTFHFIPTTEYDKITSLRKLLNISSIAAKYITVFIPKESIYYEYKETETSEPIKIYAYEDFTYSYRVNYQTNDKIYITFADSESSYGTRSGSMTSVYYYLGDEVTVGFQPSDAAFFDGWKITYYDENENEIQDSNALELQSGYALEDKSIKLTVKENCAKAVIQPLAHFKQTVKVSFNGPNGNIFPAGIREQWYEGDPINLTFTANSDYAFVGWKIYKEEDPEHALTKEQIKALHLDFGDADLFWEKIQDKGQSGEMNVSFNFKGETPGEIPDYSKNIKLIIKAETELRPKVTQTIPANGSSGNVRNTSIKIAFSEPMTNVFGEGQVNPVVVAEGIQTVSSEDIYLDTKPVDSKIDSFSLSESAKLLSIKLKTGESFSKLYYVTVKIPKTFTSAKGIAMASDYSMQFQVSSGIDNEAPEIKTLRVGKGSEDGKNVFDNVIKGSLEDFTDDNRGKKFNQPVKTIDKFTAEELSELKIINSNEKLNLYVYAQDITSPTSERLEGNVETIGYRIKNCSFNNHNISNTYNSAEYAGTIIYDTQTRDTDNESGLDGLADDKGITCSIDLDEAGVPDGLLKIDVYAMDKNNNSSLDNQNRNPDSSSEANDKLQADNGVLTFYIIKKSTGPVVTGGTWTKTSESTKVGTYSRSIDYDNYKYVNNNASISVNVDNAYKNIKSFKFEVKDSDGHIRKELNDVGYEAFKNTSTTSCVSKNSDNGDELYEFDLGEGESINTAKLTFNNFSEDLEEGDYTCNVIIGDDQGNMETKSIPFTVDLTPPEVESPHVDLYSSYTSGTNEKNVWPRVGKPGITSLEFWDSPRIVNGDGNLISFYYTSAYYNKSDYGVKLKYVDTDNSNCIPFHVYYKNNSSSQLSESTMRGDYYKAANVAKSGTKSTDSSKSYSEGTYSFVAVDEAGNVSKAHTVIIVKDTTKPSNTYKDGKLLKEYALRGGESNVTWSKPTGDTWWARSTNEGSGYWNFWDNGSHSSQGMYSCIIGLKGSNVKNATIKFPMTGHAAGDRYDGGTWVYLNSGNSRYEDFKPSRTNAGITQFIVGRRWADWNTHDNDSFTASTYNQEYFDCDYHEDSISFQIYKDYNHDNGKKGTLYNKQGPIHFGLVDGCGNEINCQKLDVIGQGGTWNYTFYLEY